MRYGICLLSIIPCRKEPSGASEMVTQLLFGELFSVTTETEDWLKINTNSDHYECWISRKQYTRITEHEFAHLKSQGTVFSSELVHTITNTISKTSFPITIGATLPALKNSRMRFAGSEFFFEGAHNNNEGKKTSQQLISTACLFLNAPYLWGGRSPFGIDCSGFTQLVYQLNGYKLPRDAHQQVETGTALSFVEESEAGDLAFFDNEEGKIVHVGILLGNNRIIHASGCVRIDNLDHYGIYNGETKKYSHTLRVIKRLL